MEGQVLEIVVPLGYLLCFLAAYFGPNAAILGNIGSSRWQYSKVEDIWASTSSLVLLVSIDTATFLISALLLYKVGLLYKEVRLRKPAFNVKL